MLHPRSNPRLRTCACALLVLICGLNAARAQAQGFRQTQTDDYTRYELLDPASHSFRIRYDVSATAAGAPFYFNAIRAGAEEEVHSVIDLMTGRPLPWKVVTGDEARRAGMSNASPTSRYIQVTLARPVPEGGQARVRIDKTYRDTASYFTAGDAIVFDRSLGIDRNAVLLPAGYELVSVNYPSQAAEEGDGRLRVSFMNDGPAAVPYRVQAKRRAARTGVPSAVENPARATATTPVTPAAGGAAAPAGGAARVDYRFTERAFEDRDITYFLQQPGTHAFRLYHDYTETRPGMDRYINVVRAGSRSSNPSATILDTGEKLRVETLRGAAITAKGLDIGETVTPETEVVVIWFTPVPQGGSVRLRIEETYTDPARYVLQGNELVWDRAFGRPRNTVVLPEGWYLTANAVPAVISTLEDGRVRLRYINDRPGEIAVFVKARRR
jgi:hypothetical protein